MIKLFFDTKANGYSPEQCGKTLTAGELAAMLSEYDYDTPIYFRNDNGYTYGNITEQDIDEREVFEDDEE